MSRAYVITLPNWLAALAAVNTAPAKAVLLGTSTVQGANATTLGRRYHQLISNRLARLYYGSKSIEYYSPQADVATTLPDYFSYTDGSGSHALVNDGLSLRTVTLTNGASVSITLTTSLVTVMFVQGAAYGQGTVAVDASSTQWFTDARAGDNHDGVYTPNGVSYGSHTITITAPVSGSIKFTGIVSHNYANGNASKGIYFYNSGHGGFTSANFVGQTALYQRIANIAPQLVVIMPGTNDYGASMAIDTYTANVVAMIVSVKAAAPNADIMIVTPYRRLDLTGSVPWSSYQAANQSMATAYGCAYIDLTDKYPSSQALDIPDFIDTDSLHQLDPGHWYMHSQLFPAFV